MQTIKFYSNKNLRKLASDTLRAKKFYIPYMDKTTTKKGFWLVKDDGIYLINAFKLNKGKNPTDEGYTTYANGYNPNTIDSDELWEKTHRFSSDDFVEFIQLPQDQLKALKFGYALQINLTKTTVETIVLRPSIEHFKDYELELKNA